MARSLKDKPQYKYAVAGRNKDKLKKFLSDSSKIVDLDLTGVPIVIADSSNEDSLVQMAKSCRILLNCVGPYRLYGEPVVKACVENGTSHLDISGEPIYIEKMQQKYHDLAVKNKCYIVGACGWDSIPCDMGVDFTRRHFGGELMGVETFCYMKEGPHGYKINTGTYQTLLLGFAHSDDLRPIRKQIMPDRVPQLMPKLAARTPMFHSEELSGWSVIFPGSDKSVVTRSIYHNYHAHAQRPFYVHTYMKVGSLFRALVVALWAAWLTVMCKFGVTLKFCQDNPELVSGGVFSSQGPSRLQAKTSSFEYWFLAKGWSKDKCSGCTDTHSMDTDKTMTVRCDGPDVGYNATASCIVSAALSIREDSDKLPAQGGVFTPSVAFGETEMLERLAQRNITFKVVEENKK